MQAGALTQQCGQVSRATLVPLLGRLQELPALQLALQLAMPPPPAFPYRPAASEADASAKPGGAAAAAPGAAALAAAGLLVRVAHCRGGVVRVLSLSMAACKL